MRRAVTETHLESLETLLKEFRCLGLHFLQIGAVELAVVAGDLLLGAPPQQLEHRLVHALAEDVPDRDVDGRDRRHAHALAAPGVRGAVHALVQVLVVPRVLAEHQRCEVFVDDGLGDLRRERHVAQADDAVVGLHLDHGPAVEPEGVHRVLARRVLVGPVVVDQVHGVGAEVSLGWNGLAFPLEDTGADGSDFHGVGLRSWLEWCQTAIDRPGRRGPCGRRSGRRWRWHRHWRGPGPRCRRPCRVRAW